MEHGTRTSLRDRKRHAVRKEVADVAVDLFLASGYETTTVGQIAAASGLSSRSFFRYFEIKEDVVLHLIDEAGVGIADRLAARPPAEDAWPALRRSFDDLVEQLISGERALQMMQLIYDTPELYAHNLLKQTRWSQLIAEALALRLTAMSDDEERRLSAGSIAGAAVSCFEYARFEWARCDGGRPLPELLDLAMSTVSPLS